MMNFDCDFIGKDSQFKIANDYGNSNIMLRYGNNCCARVNVPRSGGSMGGSIMSCLCSKTTLFILAIAVCAFLYTSCGGLGNLGFQGYGDDCSSDSHGSSDCSSGCSDEVYSCMNFDMDEDSLKTLMMCGLVICLLMFCF